MERMSKRQPPTPHGQTCIKNIATKEQYENFNEWSENSLYTVVSRMPKTKHPFFPIGTIRTI